MHSTIWRKLTAVLSAWLMVVAPTIVGCNVVPRPPTDGGDGPVFVESSDPDSDVAGFLDGSAGNVFAVLGEKDSQGSTTRVTGAYYKAADGSSWTVFLGDDGLPDRLVAGDWVFLFDNYAGNTVDLTVIAPDGTTETVGGISLNGAFLALLEDAASAGETGSALTGKARTFASAKGNLAAAKISFSKLLQYGNAALGLATCAVSIGVSAGIIAGSAFLATPAGVALTIVGCSGAVVSTINLFVDDEGLSASSTTISTVTCVASAFTQCGGLINDIGIRIVDDLETAENSETVPNGGGDSNGTPGSNLVVNGEFTNNADGWTLINHDAANWMDTAGWDGNPGWFFVNDFPGVVPETSQLITGLVPGRTYRVSGYYFRHTANWSGDPFRVVVDNEELFSAAGPEADWTFFSFTFVAGDTDTLLRFRSQVTGDDGYGIDGIRVVAE